jgi:hypothetical protein
VSSVIVSVGPFSDDCSALPYLSCKFPQGALSRDVLGHAVSQDIELTSSLIGVIAADVVLFPMETILHR